MYVCVDVLDVSAYCLPEQAESLGRRKGRRRQGHTSPDSSAKSNAHALSSLYSHLFWRSDIMMSRPMAMEAKAEAPDLNALMLHTLNAVQVRHLFSTKPTPAESHPGGEGRL